MHLGWSSRSYPLYADDLAALDDYAGESIPPQFLPDDEVILFMAKGRRDTLLRGREIVEKAGSGTVNVRIVFVPSVRKWNLAATLVRAVRNLYRYKSSGTYHIKANDVRRMALERAIRTLSNPHRRGKADRLAKMKRLENSLREKGYDDSRPIAIMLLRSGGMEDSLRQGHHRVSACIECGIQKMAVRFTAAGALPRSLAWLAKWIRTRRDVMLHALSNAFSTTVERAVKVPGRGPQNLIVVPQDGGRFVLKLLKSRNAAEKVAEYIESVHPQDLLSPRPIQIGRYFAVKCRYGMGRALPIDIEKHRRKHDFDRARVVAEMESGWGIGIESCEPLNGHAHSLNYKVTLRDGRTFAAKMVPSSRANSLARLVSHKRMASRADTTTLLFDGKILHFGNWDVIATRWIDGIYIKPENLPEDKAKALLEAHAQFLRALSDDGCILPARDLAAMKNAVLERAKKSAARAVIGELETMDTSPLPPENLKIIHGDMHYENFRFRKDGSIGFLDIEELRLGTPAEDIVRYILTSAERLGPLAFLMRRKLIKTFSLFVAASPYSRAEWIFAINSFILKKLAKKTQKRGLSHWDAANLAFRMKFYARLRECVYALKPAARADARTVVKVVGGTVRRFTGKDGVDWKGRYLFTADPSCEDYDWLCVYDEMPPRYGGKIRLRCPQANTMLLTQEPESIKSYSKAYTDQFAVVLTNRSDFDGRRPGLIRGAGYMVWYTGRSFGEEKAAEPVAKERIVSAVYSAKNMRSTLHARRCAFLDLMEKNVPGFDRFGKGVRKIERKCDAIDAYKYHICHENHAQKGFWTEKIADALVCRALPFYIGDPDICKAIPEKAVIRIPADEPPEKAAQTVRAAIENGEYERRKDAIEEARALMFEKYNMFAQIAMAIESSPADRKPPHAKDGVLLSRHRLRRNPAVALSDLAGHFLAYFKSRRHE